MLRALVSTVQRLQAGLEQSFRLFILSLQTPAGLWLGRYHHNGVATRSTSTRFAFGACGTGVASVAGIALHARGSGVTSVAGIASRAHLASIACIALITRGAHIAGIARIALITRGTLGPRVTRISGVSLTTLRSHWPGACTQCEQRE